MRLTMISTLAAATVAILSAAPASAASFIYTLSGAVPGTIFTVNRDADPMVRSTQALILFTVTATGSIRDNGVGDVRFTGDLFDDGQRATISYRWAGAGLSETLTFEGVSTGTDVYRGNVSYGQTVFSGTAYSFSGAATLRRMAYTGPLTDIAININSVPEPATWAMMIAGFALVGGAARRRSQPEAA